MIGQMPHLSIGEPGIHVTRSCGIGEQGIRHVVEGLRQPTRQWLPGCAPNRADNSGLSIVLAVRFEWTGSNRGIPNFRTGRVGSHHPTIVPGKTVLWLFPGHARIPADRDTCSTTTTFIHPVAIGDMEGERVAITQRPP